MHSASTPPPPLGPEGTKWKQDLPQYYCTGKMDLGLGITNKKIGMALGFVHKWIGAKFELTNETYTPLFSGPS